MLDVDFDESRIPDVLATTEWDDLFVRHHVPVFRPNPWAFTQERIDMEVRWAACDHPRWVRTESDFIRGIEWCVDCHMPRVVEEHRVPDICSHVQFEPLDNYGYNPPTQRAEWMLVVVTHPCSPETVPAPASPS